VSHHGVTGRTQEQPGQGASAAAADHNQLRLLDEWRAPGVTHQAVRGLATENLLAHRNIRILVHPTRQTARRRSHDVPGSQIRRRSPGGGRISAAPSCHGPAPPPPPPRYRGRQLPRRRNQRLPRRAPTRPRQPGSGRRGGLGRTGSPRPGHRLCAATCKATEPRSTSRTRPWPSEPTTVRLAPRLASTKADRGSDLVSVALTSRPG